MNRVLCVLVLFSVSFSMFTLGCIKDKPVGDNRDEHGCLPAAGYTWNESVGACLREWELSRNQKRVAKIAVDYVGYEKGLTILEVESARCPGCFAVQLEKGKDRIHVILEKWKVKDKTLTPDECEAKGGMPVNTVGGGTCKEDERNIGEVTGFISPHICCVPSPGSGGLTFEEAMKIARNSGCVEEGELTEEYTYNNYTKTWWIDLNVDKTGCNPACVVNEKTKTAEVNWRCTGLLPEKHVCTIEEKKAEACTMEYAPVCGSNGKTYGNKCMACSSKEIYFWMQGACPGEDMGVGAVGP